MSISRLVDERFLEHRRRSTSTAGMLCAAFALLLFLYRYYWDGVLSWDLFAVGATFAGIKLGLMVWYRLTD